MLAQVIREDRFGEPLDAFRIEEIAAPKLEPDEVLVQVMAAGVNFNGVFAAMGQPVNVIGMRRKSGDPDDFHIAGSDASGIVVAVGADVREVVPGAEVVLHCGVWDGGGAAASAGADVTLSSSFRIWGYETNWGSFAELTKVKSFQCLPKPAHLSWEEASVTTLVGATAYRMLTHWAPHNVREGDVVLVWGGAGGLGCMAIQIARAFGAVPIAVTSSAEKARFCMSLGAAGCIDRTQFGHWGPLKSGSGPEYDRWREGAGEFAKAMHEILGERRFPRIVFEHSGNDTLPTSIFACEPGGMVVTCGATSGYLLDVDARYLWMRQKRLQGSHYGNLSDIQAFHRLVMDGRISPCLTKTYAFSEVGEAHQRLKDNAGIYGKTAISIGSASRNPVA